MDIGSHVVHVNTQKTGFVQSFVQRRAPMVQVKWEHSDMIEILPIAMIRPSDKAASPPPQKLVPLARNTPAYMLAIKKQNTWEKRKSNQKKRLAAENLTRDLLKLSNPRKPRIQNYAKKLIAKYNRRTTP